jgi:hypothetical protein
MVSQRYTVRGIEEVYDSNGELECKNKFGPFGFRAKPEDDLLELGRKKLQKRIDAVRVRMNNYSEASYIGRVTEIRDPSGRFVVGMNGLEREK